MEQWTQKQQPIITPKNTINENKNSRGVEARTHKNHIYDWVEYEKSWTIQDMDGSAYRVEVSLREYENVALCYVNGQWVGRCLYLSEAEKVVAAIKAGCR